MPIQQLIVNTATGERGYQGPRRLADASGLDQTAGALAAKPADAT